ncbi:MAG: GNAT family N-acetyltransferase, partial [Planctomycetes bacterium]|nr:GNAT family N-acetyltransferase [Planctomycetota bacterium]
MKVDLAVEPDLTVAEFIDVLERSTLAERRPVDDQERIARMLRHSDLIVTARDETGRLLGVSRAVSDFGYCVYVSDLAVDVTAQGNGIGRDLLRRTHREAGPGTTLIL